MATLLLDRDFYRFSGTKESLKGNRVCKAREIAPERHRIHKTVTFHSLDGVIVTVIFAVVVSTF